MLRFIVSLVVFVPFWLLDVYVKDDANKSRHPRAVFMCSPLIRKALP